jgi:myo-inositol catabolism protein IolC
MSEEALKSVSDIQVHVTKGGPSSFTAQVGCKLCSSTFHLVKDPRRTWTVSNVVKHLVTLHPKEPLESPKSKQRTKLGKRRAGERNIRDLLVTPSAKKSTSLEPQSSTSAMTGTEAILREKNLQ